jgi:virginiamycin B lyase
MKEFPVPAGSGPHDVAPAADGGVWFTAQRSGQLGWLDPKTGQTKMIPLGAGSAPHGVIVGPDGAPWITDGGLNAIVRVDPKTGELSVFKLPGQNVNLNTAVFDRTGKLWWTGQGGWYGSLNVGAPGSPGGGGTGRESNMGVYQAPRGAGPYGITATPSGDVFYASLAGSHIARIDVTSERATPIDPPTKDQGARRVWSDSKGVVWVSEWNVGQLARYDPATGAWKEWKLPGARPQAYAVFVDDRDVVWLSEWSASAIVRFDPATEKFDVFPHAPGGSVRQLHGRPGEVWGALSALDKLIVLTTR